MVYKHPCPSTDPADCKAPAELAFGSLGRVDVLFHLAIQGRVKVW